LIHNWRCPNWPQFLLAHARVLGLGARSTMRVKGGACLCSTARYDSRVRHQNAPCITARRCSVCRGCTSQQTRLGGGYHRGAPLDFPPLRWAQCRNRTSPICPKTTSPVIQLTVQVELEHRTNSGSETSFPSLWSITSERAVIREQRHRVRSPVPRCGDSSRVHPLLAFVRPGQ
jgi:hypothetical protein